MTRLLRPRAAIAVLVIVLSANVFFSTVGNAAGLSIIGRSGGLFSQGAARCTDGPLTVSPSGTPAGGQYAQVTVTGDFGSCTGGNVSVYLSASPNTVLFSGAGTVSGGSMTVASSAFTPPATTDGDVVLGLNGWAIPASWAYVPPAPEPQGPVTPGDNIEFVGDGPSWNVMGVGNQFCFDAVVRGTSPTPAPWTLDLHVTQRPFNGRTTTSGLQLYTWNGYEWVSNNAVDGVLQIRGTGAKATISASQEYTVTLCDYGSPPPLYDPVLTYTVSPGAITGDANWACMAVTVAVAGTPLFYAGWRADVDVTPLLALRTGTPVFGVQEGDHQVAFLGGTTYRVTGSGWGTGRIRDDAPRAFHICG